MQVRTMVPTDVTSSQLPLDDVNSRQDDVYLYARYSLTTPITYACANDVIINNVIALDFSIAVIANHRLQKVNVTFCGPLLSGHQNMFVYQVSYLLALWLLSYVSSTERRRRRRWTQWEIYNFVQNRYLFDI